MRDIVSPFGLRNPFGGKALDIYRANAFRPELVVDAINEYYRKGRSDVNFLDVITHNDATAGNATMTGGYGPELITNGGFDSSDSWTLGTDHFIQDGVLHVYSPSGAFSETLQTGVLTVGKAYEAVVEIKQVITAGGGVSDNQGNSIGDAAGIYKYTFTAEFTSFGIKRTTGTTHIVVDNISVREVPKIQWRPHNLVPNSEDLSTSDWTGSQTTRTQVALSNPLGVTYVSQVVDTTVNSTHPVFSAQDGNSKVGVKYTAAMWAKAKSNARTINFQGFGNGANSPIFDLETGTITAAGSDWSDQSITDAGDGWYFITASTVATATAKFQFALRDGTTATYAGTGNHGVYIVGAHLYRSDLGGMADVPMSERVLPSANTYVRTAGREVSGIELITNGTFDTDVSGWTKAGSTSHTLTYSSGEAVLTKDASNAGDDGFGNLHVPSITGRFYQITWKGKRVSGAGAAKVRIYDNGGNGQMYDSNYYTDADFTTEVGYFVALSDDGFNVYLYCGGGAVAGQAGFDDVSVKEIDVNPATARYLPRIGHHVYNGSQWVNEGLLHESGSRTNLFSDNHDLDGQGLQNATVTVDDAVSPTGEENAVALFETTANSEHAMTFSEADFGGSLTNGNQYTFSIFVKPIGSRNLRIGFTAVAMGDQGRCYFNLSDGTLSTFNNNADAATIEDVGNGWYRVSVTDTVTVASATGTIVIVQSTDASENEVFAGDTSSGLHLFGAQLEVGPTASSYIPTIGSTVTRAAETLTIEHENLPWSSSAVSIAMDGRMTYADTGVYGAVIPLEWKENNDNKFSWELSTNSTDQGRFVFIQDSSSVRDIVSSGTDDYLPDVLVPFNLSARYTSNALNAAIDGVSLTANTTPTSITDLEDTDFALGKIFMGTIGSLRIWANDIGDDGIIEATEPELQPTLSLSFDGTESSFIDFEWSE